MPKLRAADRADKNMDDRNSEACASSKIFRPFEGPAIESTYVERSDPLGASTPSTIRVVGSVSIDALTAERCRS
jgi:hypothetical protein